MQLITNCRLSNAIIQNISLLYSDCERERERAEVEGRGGGYTVCEWNIVALTIF